MSNPPPLPPGMPPFRPIGHQVSAVREESIPSESQARIRIAHSTTGPPMFIGSITASLSQLVDGKRHPPGTQPLGIPGLGRHRGSAEVGAGRERTGVENAGGQNGRRDYDVVFSQRPGEVENERGEGGEGARAYEHGTDDGNINSDEDDSLFGGGSNEESGGKEDDGPIEGNNGIDSAGNNEDYQSGANERKNDNNCEDEKEKVVANHLSTRFSEGESEASRGPADPFHGLADLEAKAADTPNTGGKTPVRRNSEEDWPDDESAEGPAIRGKTPPAIIPQGDHEDEEDCDPANGPTTGGKGISNVIPDDGESRRSNGEATGRRKYSSTTAAIIPDANENEAERVIRPNVACKFIGLDRARWPGGDGDDHDAEVEGQEEDEIDAGAEAEPEPASAKAKTSRKQPAKTPAKKDSAERYVEENAGPEPQPANTNKRKEAMMTRVSPKQEEDVGEKEDDALPSPPKKKRARTKASRAQYPDGKIRCIYVKPAKGRKHAERCGNRFLPRGSLYCHSSTHVTGPAAGGGAGGAGRMAAATQA